MSIQNFFLHFCCLCCNREFAFDCACLPFASDILVSTQQNQLVSTISFAQGVCKRARSCVDYQHSGSRSSFLVNFIKIKIKPVETATAAPMKDHNKCYKPPKLSETTRRTKWSGFICFCCDTAFLHKY